jgi:hypothetical protein
MPDASHRFTEAEVRAIFEEAARRQSARQAAAAPGLTLAELQAVAAETGLDPDLVAAAAAHLPEDTPETKKYPLWDVPEEVRVERVIPGEVSDELWERMVAELRRTFGQTGRAGQVGRVREWSTEKSSGETSAPIYVEARPEGEQTRIVLTQSLKAYREAGLGIGLSMTGTAVLLTTALALFASPGNLGSVFLLVVLFLAAGLLGGFGMRQTARHQLRKQTAAFEGALDRLDLLALRATPTVAAPPVAAAAPLAEAPRQGPELALDPEASAEEEARAARRRTRS